MKFSDGSSLEIAGVAGRAANVPGRVPVHSASVTAARAEALAVGIVARRRRRLAAAIVQRWARVKPATQIAFAHPLA
jgi:hypothetical protein